MPHINDSVTFASVYRDMSEYFKNNYEVTFETRGSQRARKEHRKNDSQKQREAANDQGTHFEALP